MDCRKLLKSTDDLFVYAGRGILEDTFTKAICQVRSNDIHKNSYYTLEKNNGYTPIYWKVNKKKLMSFINTTVHNVDDYLSEDNLHGVKSELQSLISTLDLVIHNGEVYFE